MYNIFLYFVIKNIIKIRTHILNLISTVQNDANNAKKWDKIINMIETNKLDLNDEIINGSNILHLAAIHNNKYFIDYICDNRPIILNKSNLEGNTFLHLLALHKHYELLKLYSKKCGELTNLVNNDNQTILNIVIPNFDIISWLLLNVPNIDVNVIPNNGLTIVMYCIKQSVGKNDKYFNLLSKLIKTNKCDLTVPKDMPPICYASKKGKTHIIELLLKNKNSVDINSLDKNYLSALSIAAINNQTKTCKYLLNHGANVDYAGPAGDKHMLIIAMQNHNLELCDLLFIHNINTSIHDKFLETPLHYLLNNNHALNLPQSLIFKLCYYSDLNCQNINGVTPLHILLEKYDWRIFKSILVKKRLDIYIKNIYHVKPIDYIKKKDLKDFFNIVLESFIQQLNTNQKNHKKYLHVCSKNFMLDDCQNTIISQIKKTKCSYPIGSRESSSYNDKHGQPYCSKLKNQNLILHSSIKSLPKTNYGLFNSDILHSMIYLIILLTKYPNIMLPFQYFNYDKVIHTKMIFDMSLYKDDESQLLSEIIKLYTDYFYEISPYIILWRDKESYYINPNLKLLFKKCLNSDKIRFIILKLTLIVSLNGTHANIIIFDKKTGIMERFEPYGNIPYLDAKNMDILFENIFITYVDSYLFDHDLKFQYINSNAGINSVGFQTLSNDLSPSNKKSGDPVGYCLAWTLWYLEMRIANPDIHPHDLTQKLTTFIATPSKSIKLEIGEKLFIDYIRDYASHLNKLKNDYILQCGVSKENTYNIVMSDSDTKKILNNLVVDFNKIIYDI